MTKFLFLAIVLLPMYAEVAMSYDLVMKVVSEKKPSDQDHYFVWAINLDETNADEYVVASGYSDGIDYSVYRNPKNEDSLILRFNPILIDDSNKSQPYYWGYPWDTKNIVTKREKNQTKILCSFDHRIDRDGEIDIPSWQKQVPAIFFTGESSQPESHVGDVGEQQWLTLDQIAAKVKVSPGTP